MHAVARDPQPLPAVRLAVRNLLSGTPGFRSLAADDRKALARQRCVCAPPR